MPKAYPDSPVHGDGSPKHKQCRPKAEGDSQAGSIPTHYGRQHNIAELIAIVTTANIYWVLLWTHCALFINDNLHWPITFTASCYRNGRLEFSNLLKVTAGQDLNLGGLTLEPSLSIPLGALPRNEEPELRSPLPHPCCVTADQTLPLWDLVSPSDRGLTGAKVYF